MLVSFFGKCWHCYHKSGLGADMLRSNRVPSPLGLSGPGLTTLLSEAHISRAYRLGLACHRLRLVLVCRMPL